MTNNNELNITNVVKASEALINIANAAWELNNKESDSVALLINFIEQNGLEEELLSYIDDVAKNEEMPTYRKAAKHFQLAHQFNEDFLDNNYELNKEMLESGSTFLLEDSKPLMNVNEPITMGDLPISLHDELNEQKRKVAQGLPF